MQDPKRLPKPDLILVRSIWAEDAGNKGLGWVGVRVPGRQLRIYSGGRALEQRCLGLGTDWCY